MPAKTKHQLALMIFTQAFDTLVLIMILPQHFIHNSQLGFTLPMVMAGVSVFSDFLTTLSVGLRAINKSYRSVMVSFLSGVANLVMIFALVLAYWSSDDLVDRDNNTYSITVYWIWALVKIIESLLLLLLTFVNILIYH